MISLVTIIVSVFFVLWLTSWDPKPIEVIESEDDIEIANVSDTLTILSWNIGYAGLGDDMDFFYDGGKSTRTSQGRTNENLVQIVSFLKQNSSRLDFILLQEVDFDSKRSYYVDQYNVLEDALDGFNGTKCYNYVSSYVPIPLGDAMGSVKSGLVTFSKWPVAKVLRYQYPSSFSFPVSLFNLKRGMLSAQLLLPSGDTLYVNNTHNTAFDTGNMRAQEIVFINNLLKGKHYSITVGDWNCNPPGYEPSKAEVANVNFSPIGVKRSDFDTTLSFAADLSKPTARYGYEPYKEGVTTTTLIDFALMGSKIKLISVETIDLCFKNSDHNPVIFKVAITK